jgi:hypothetical protein
MHASLALLALLAGSAHAFFRLPCAKPVVNGMIDPIVAPGKANAHAHTIMGANGISLTSTYDDMRASDCSTCKVMADKSAYWIPSLHYQFPNGSFQMVDHGGMLVYYLQRGGANETIKAFPPGLRMLTGSPFTRNNTGSDESKAINWNCIDYSNNNNYPETPGMDHTVCANGLRAQVFFPSCWDGVNLDSADHKSHMAYPDGINNGVCPKSHPVHLISIFYEVYFSVDPFNKLNDGGNFVLSTGDRTGYSLHGDFLNGWDQGILQQAVDQCTNDSGVLEDCTVFTSQNLLYTDAQTNACLAKDPVGVPVDGLLPNLPGCIAIQNGPQQAVPGALVSGCQPLAAPGTGSSGSSASSAVVPPASSPVKASTAAATSTSAAASSSAAATHTAASSSAAVATSSAAAVTPVVPGKTGILAASSAVPTAITSAAETSAASSAAATPSAPAGPGAPGSGNGSAPPCSNPQHAPHPGPHRPRPQRPSYQNKPSVHHYRRNAHHAARGSF